MHYAAVGCNLVQLARKEQRAVKARVECAHVVKFSLNLKPAQHMVPCLASLCNNLVKGVASELIQVKFGLFGAYYLRTILFSALAGGILAMALEAFFRYVFYDLLVFGMTVGRALTAFGLKLLLSLPVGALAYVLVRVVHRRFTEETT